MTQIALAIAGVGCAAVSVWACIKSKGEIGAGWALIAFFLLISLEGCNG